MVTQMTKKKQKDETSPFIIFSVIICRVPKSLKKSSLNFNSYLKKKKKELVTVKRWLCKRQKKEQKKRNVTYIVMCRVFKSLKESSLHSSRVLKRKKNEKKEVSNGKAREGNKNTKERESKRTTILHCTRHRL